MRNSNKKNKIVLATGLFPPDIGGPATFAKELADELPRHGCDVKVVVYADGDVQENKKTRKQENSIAMVSRRSNIFLRYARYFWEVLQLSKWGDVIYAFDLISVGLPCAIVKMFRPKVKLVVRVGGDYQWEQSAQAGYTKTTLRQYYRDKKFNWRERIIYAINSFVLKQADKVIFNSEFLKDIYMASRPWLSNKARVIKNIRPELSVELPKTDAGAPIRILCAGRLTAVRNIMGLLEAFNELLKDLPGRIRLDIIGDGPEYGAIEKYINEHELRGVISLQVGLEREELIKKMAGSDIMALVSLSESNPHFIAEALSLGKRVVVTKESEFGFLGLKYVNIYYVRPMDRDDIIKKLEMAIKAVEDGSAVGGMGDVLDELVWDKERVVKEHLEIFGLFSPSPGPSPARTSRERGAKGKRDN